LTTTTKSVRIGFQFSPPNHIYLHREKKYDRCSGAVARQVPLPTYAFDRKRYWLPNGSGPGTEEEAGESAYAALRRTLDA
jgi:acyl transferase domain-containing protein